MSLQYKIGLSYILVIAAVLVFLCAAAQHWDLAAAARLQNLAAWAFAALTVLMGGIRWLAADRKKHG